MRRLSSRVEGSSYLYTILGSIYLDSTYENTCGRFSSICRTRDARSQVSAYLSHCDAPPIRGERRRCADRHEDHHLRSRMNPVLIARDGFEGNQPGHPRPNISPLPRPLRLRSGATLVENPNKRVLVIVAIFSYAWRCRARSVE